MVNDSLFTTPSWLKALRFLGFLVFLGTLGGILFFLFKGGMDAANLLAERGWDRAIGRPGARGASMLAGCMMSVDTGCGNHLNDLWQKQVDFDTLRLLAVLGFALGLSPFVYQPPKPRKLPGYGRFATEKDLGAYLTPKGSGWYGQVKGRPIRVPEGQRVAHTLIVGKPGHGKTSGYYLPNLLMDAKEGWTAVVYDLKYPDKGGLMEAMNYYAYYGRPVYAFTPWGDRSFRINFLEGAEDIIQAKFIAEILVPRNPRVPDSKEFYPGLERALLTALVHAEGVEGRYSMAHIYHVLGEGVEGLQAYVEVRPYLKGELRSLLEMRRDQLAGIINGARNRLSIWLDPALAQATEPGVLEVPWEKVFSEPSLVYIGVPQHLVEGNAAGYVLLRLLKRIIDVKTMEVANKNGGRLPVATSVYWDEFPNFGLLPGIKENLGTMRSRRVAYHIAVQNTDQGRAVYGDDEWEAIEGTFAQRIYFLSGLSDPDAARLSEALGKTAVVEEHRGATRKGMLPLPTSRSAGEREVARPLLSPEEMRTAEKGEAVVFLEGVPPVRVNLFGMWRKEHLLHALWEKARRKEPALLGIPLSRKRPHVAPPASVARTPEEKAPWGRDPSRPQSLALYLEALTRRVPRFKRYYDKEVPFKRLEIELPEDFPLPEAPWAQMGWVEVLTGPNRVSLTQKGAEVLKEADLDGYYALLKWCRVLERHYKDHPDKREGPPPSEVVLEKEVAEKVLLGRVYGEAVEDLGDKVVVRTGLGLSGLRTGGGPGSHTADPAGALAGAGEGHGGGPGEPVDGGPEALGGGPEAGQGGPGDQGVPAHHG